MIVLSIEIGGQTSTVRADLDGATLGSGPTCRLVRTDAGWSPIEGSLRLVGDRLHLIAPSGERRFDLGAGERASLGTATITFVGCDPATSETSVGGWPATPRTRRSRFDDGLQRSLMRAPGLFASAGVHVLAVLLLWAYGPAPTRRRLVPPSGVLETTQTVLEPSDPVGIEHAPDDTAPPEASASRFVDPSAAEPDPTEAMAPPVDTAPEAPPADSTADTSAPVQSDAVGPDRAVIGLRVKPAPPPPPPPDPAPVPADVAVPEVPAVPVPTVDEEYATAVNQKAANRLRDELRDASGALGRAIRGVKSSDLLVVSNGRAFDHLENVLDAIGIPYAFVSVAEFATRSDLSSTRMVFWNCGPPIGDPGRRSVIAEKMRRFVESGGFLWSTDWGLRDVVAGAFPGRLATGEDKLHTLPELVVDVGPAANAANDPLLEGVLPKGPCRWWLEAASAEVRVLEPAAVRVLIEAPVLASALHRKSPVIVATFAAGKGRVLHVMGHAWQEKTDLDGTVGMQRLALNFIRMRVEAGPAPGTDR